MMSLIRSRKSLLLILFVKYNANNIISQERFTLSKRTAVEFVESIEGVALSCHINNACSVEMC